MNDLYDEYIKDLMDLNSIIKIEEYLKKLIEINNLVFESDDFSLNIKQIHLSYFIEILEELEFNEIDNIPLSEITLDQIENNDVFEDIDYDDEAFLEFAERYLIQINQSITNLIADVTEEILDIEDNDEFDITEVMQVLEDVRDAKYEQTYPKMLDWLENLDYEEDLLNEEFVENLEELIEDIGDSTSMIDSKKYIDEFIEEQEKGFNLKLKPMFDKESKKEVEDYLSAIRELRNMLSVNEPDSLSIVQNEFNIADTPELDVKLEPFIEKIVDSENVVQARIEITKLMSTLKSHYELGIENPKSVEKQSNSLEVKTFLNILKEVQETLSYTIPPSHGSFIKEFMTKVNVDTIPKMNISIKDSIKALLETDYIFQAEKQMKSMIDKIEVSHNIKPSVQSPIKHATSIPSKKEVRVKELLYFEDKKENIEINRLLKVFHSISKPHKPNPIYPGFGLKYQAIIKTLKENISPKDFSNLKIKFNEKIGLLVESKDGLDSENQKLIMSHCDLVPTFEKAHTDVMEGKRKSALTVDEDGNIRGSLDNTLPNATVILSMIDKKFESDTSILFEIDEETGMTGSSNFFDNKYKSGWSDVSLSSDLNFNLTKISQNESKDLKIKEIKDKMTYNSKLFDEFLSANDIATNSDIGKSLKKKYKENKNGLENEVLGLESQKLSKEKLIQILPSSSNIEVVVNTDVTMGQYSTKKSLEPFALEVESFSGKSEKEIGKKFPDGAIMDYGDDDSLSTMTRGIVGLACCINTGNKVTKVDGGFQYSGGCHSMLTATSKTNIERYIDIISEVAISLGNDLDIKLETKKAWGHSHTSSFNSHTSVSSIHHDSFSGKPSINHLGSTQKDYGIDINYDEVDFSYDGMSTEQPAYLEDDFEDDPEKYATILCMVEEALESSLQIKDVQLLDDDEDLDLSEDEIKSLVKELKENVEGIKSKHIKKCKNIDELTDKVCSKITEQELVDYGLNSIMSYNDDEDGSLDIDDYIDPMDLG